MRRPLAVRARPLLALALLVPMLYAAPPARAAATTPSAPAHRDPDVRLVAVRFGDVVMDHANNDGFAYYTKIVGLVRTTFSSGSGYQPVQNAVTTGLRINGAAPSDPAFTNIGFQFLDGGRQRVGTFVPLALGPGRYVVGPVNLAITTGSGDRDVLFQARDTFFVRQPTVAGLKAVRHGARVTLKVTSQVRAWRTWTLGRTAPRVRVERKVGGRWRAVTTVRLDRAGKGTKVIRAAARFRYRTRITQTSTRVGRVATTPRV